MRRTTCTESYLSLYLIHRVVRTTSIFESGCAHVMHGILLMYRNKDTTAAYLSSGCGAEEVLWGG